MKKIILVIFLLLSASAFAKTPDPVVFSFTFFGCNRLDDKGVEKTGSASTANVAQLQQDFAEISKLAPQYVFLAGDIVLGLSPGDTDLKSQLSLWKRKFGKASGKLKIVAFSGNHEMLQKIKSKDGAKSERPNPPAYSLWPASMKDYIAGNNGPSNTAPNPDGLTGDESRLSYTFQSGPYFFMILNTDTMIDANTIGDIPLKWIAEKLAAAQSDPKIEHIFVMGHKPIVAPKDGQDPSGAESILKSQGRDFYALLNQNSKVRAYLSAHAHEWNYSPALFNGKIPQIVAGNGGSPPNKNWQKPHDYFGYTLVTVKQSGKIEAYSYGRDIPSPYYKQKHLPSSTLRASYTLLSGN